jgi:hypothetical protein
MEPKQRFVCSKVRLNGGGDGLQVLSLKYCQGLDLLGQQKSRAWPQGIALCPYRPPDAQFQREITEGGIKPIARLGLESCRGDTRR